MHDLILLWKWKATLIRPIDESTAEKNIARLTSLLKTSANRKEEVTAITKSCESQATVAVQRHLLIGLENLDWVSISFMLVIFKFID